MMTLRAIIITSILTAGLTACVPTVQIKAPDKPIEINLNIKIDQEVRIRLDKDIEDLLANNPDIF
ncbi:MAG: YnbE family lipoprotein [Robiginitomaculum sp.]